jgi:hypothetical protein
MQVVAAGGRDGQEEVVRIERRWRSRGGEDREQVRIERCR